MKNFLGILKNINRVERGVTLIELLISMSLFASVSSVIVVVIVSISTNQQRVLNDVKLDNSIYFSMESMAKEIRTGRDFSFFGCVWSDISSVCDGISFTNYLSQPVTYKKKLVGANNHIEKSCSGVCPPSGLITPDDVNISYLGFNIDGQNNGGTPDRKQVKVSIVMKAETIAGTSVSRQREVYLQTTISSRQSDS